MTFNELAQVGVGALGSGGGVWALVRAYIAIKPHLKNGNGSARDHAEILKHLERQGDTLASIAQDIHLSTERLQELVQDNREYQREGREAMLRISALYHKEIG